jgi:hypothetical protein
MAQSPITKTMDEMLEKLADALRTYYESEKSVGEYTSAIRALAKVCEDEEVRTTYLLKLEELSGKPGFLEAVRSVFRVELEAITPSEIKGAIELSRRLDFSGYSNPMASIHTTLRRLKQKGEIEEVTNKKGEKAFRRIVKAPIPPASMRKKMNL